MERSSKTLTFSWRFAAFLAALCVWIAIPRAAWAQSCDRIQCRGGDPSAAACVSMGRVCVDDDGDTTGGVVGSCQYPCQSQRDCSLGETCTSGRAPGGAQLYCRRIGFKVDLNVVDSCIAYFVNGMTQVTASSPNDCGLASQLMALVDQADPKGTFNIDDVDACIQKFLDTPACNTSTKSCASGDVYCDSDAACGDGLYCDAALHRCSRDCGFIPDRTARDSASLDRQCYARMTACNYSRGRCEEVDAQKAKCQVDADCPASAYCMLGSCAPRCYRSSDCPGSSWICGKDNSCQPRPPPSSSATPFDPRDYSVLFSDRQIALDVANDTYDIPIVIMNTAKKAQVFSAPEVVFGYRLELKYAKKLDPKCDDLTNASDDVRRDCLVSPDKEFVTLDSPFGTLFADGDPKLGIRVNQTAVGNLSPGTYEAVLSAIFSTGTTDAIRIRFEKPSLNGEYDGRLSVYADVPENLVGTSTFAMHLVIRDKDPVIKWEDLLAANNIQLEQEFRDITEGYRVEGLLHGNTTQIFNNPSSMGSLDNEIAIKGIYSPQLGRVRLVSVIDLAADHCRSLTGDCTTAAGELQAKNPFKRAIRRYVQLIGPFDVAHRTFEGVYREAIIGLAPYTITLDGGFRLSQSRQDDAPINNWATPLVARDTQGSPVRVAYPTISQIQDAADAQVAKYCPAAADRNRALNASTFSAFAAAIKDGPPASFDSAVTTALNSLKDNQGQGALTVFEYLRGSLPFCSATVTQNCINAAQLRCHVALFQKGLANGWVDPSQITGDGKTLFCPAAPSGSSDCSSSDPVLNAYQGHNRVYQALLEALMFGAGADASDAFYVLYKPATDFSRSTAFAYKQDRLTSALAQYDEALSQFTSPVASYVLLNWPMVSFQNRGQAWIQQGRTLVKDRTSTLYSLFDVKRRFQGTTGGADRIFADHLLQNEYLVQVFLMALEKGWERERFVYSGFDPENPGNPLESGDLLLAKVDDTRNPLGIHPDRVYFETDVREKMNWQFYLDHLLEDINGSPLKKGLTAYVTESKAEIRGSLSDQDTLHNKLEVQAQQLETQLDTLCGSATPLPTACDKKAEDKSVPTGCNGGSCGFEYHCDDDQCESVVQRWSQGVDDVSCRADTDGHDIVVAGTARPCVRGKMGTLLEERISLDLDRKQTVARVNQLMRTLAGQTAYLREVEKANKDVADYLDNQDKEIEGIQAAMAGAELALDIALSSSKAIDCLTIVGVAAGTNCPNKAIVTALEVAAISAKHGATDGAKIGLDHLARAKEMKLSSVTVKKEELQLTQKIDETKSEIEGVLAAYAKVQQQLFNIDIQIQDTHNSANLVAAQYGQQVGAIVDRLVGRESGSALVRNGMVQELDARFNEALVDAYKLSHAVAHRYNLQSLQTQLDNQIFQAATVDDLKTFASTIDTLVKQRCGNLGIDCDQINNSKLFHFDFRKQLFPSLQPIVDGNTGSVLSVGDQFHNEITSSRYLRKYGDRVDIEIPFAIWPTDRGALPTGSTLDRYMLPPDECNHVIVGATSAGGQVGTLAVEVIGQNIPNDDASGSGPPPLRYYLARGPTEYARSCEPKTGKDFVINSYTVGPPPESQFAHASTPPSFILKTDWRAAYIGVSNPDSFIYFLRDHALASPDWLLVIPDVGVGGSQRWIYDGIPGAGVKSTIEDLILHVRHNALRRPGP